MSESTGSLLNQGLIMTVLGMSLVFAALALLWGLMRLLTWTFRDTGVEAAKDTQGPGPEPVLAAADAVPDVAAEQLTAERAHVAALVAGALLSNALPMMFEPPSGPAFEHGRVAPSWVVGNRSHALQRWAPQRKPESSPQPQSHF